MANQSEQKPRTVLNALINNTTSYANLDYNYGPYDDVDDAKTACVKLKAPVGFTVGVLAANGNALNEYKVESLDNSSGAYDNIPGYFKYPGDTDKIYTLVKKQTTGSTLDLTASHSGSDPEANRPYTTVTIRNNGSEVGSFRVYDGKKGDPGSSGSGGTIEIPNSGNHPITGDGTTLQGQDSIDLQKITAEGTYLMIDGAVHIDGTVNITNDVNITGKVNARDGFYETSDARLKTDVQTAELDYDHILDKIRPVLYHWKFDQEGPLELGFVAQEIQELVPQVVSGEKQLSVNYAKLSTVALGACKHLMQRLNQLENRVKDIEEKLK